MRQLIFQFFFSYSKSLVPKSRYESIQHSSAKSLTENDNNSYVGNAGSGDISVIDGDINEVIETIDVLSNPYDLEFSSFDNYVYVMNQPYVSIIDTRSNTVFANIQVDSNLIEIQVNSNNGNIYVSSSSNYALEYNPENMLFM